MKKLVILLSVFALFSCKKEVIQVNERDQSLSGVWSHSKIKYCGSNSFQESSDHHTIHISSSEIVEWNASYTVKSNELDIVFSETGYHEQAFFSKNGDTLSIAFSNGNVSRYVKE